MLKKCSEAGFDTMFVFNVFAGRPEEQDDSENSTIYITGLTEKAKVEEMAEFFKHVGPIRVRKHQQKPTHQGSTCNFDNAPCVHR